MTIGATLTASLLITLARPATWPLGLVGFLLRGGLALVVAPIVVLPTPVGLANVLAPLLEDVAFGRRTGELAGLLAVAVGIVLAWLVVGGLSAAASEMEAARQVAADDELAIDGVSRRVAATPGRAWRVVVVRLVAYVPLLIALAWGAVRLISVTYRELSVPSDVTVPIFLRVLTGAPDAIAAIALAWFVGEVVGALASRRIILLGEGVPRSLRGGLGRFLRHPGRELALAVLTTVVLALALALTGLAAAAAWDALRAALAFGHDPLIPLLLVLAFVGLFAGGLVLVSVVAAWRGAVWTVELAGTFGAGHGVPTGD